MSNSFYAQAMQSVSECRYSGECKIIIGNQANAKYKYNAQSHEINIVTGKKKRV